MILQFWKRWTAIHRQRRAMGWMLKRKDDHWLNDIGMTRNDLRIMLKKDDA